MSNDADIEEALHFWYVECTDRAFASPTGSFEHVFWWSLRMELSDRDLVKQWANKPAEAFESWVRYMLFKWTQLEPHRRHRNDQAPS